IGRIGMAPDIPTEDVLFLFDVLRLACAIASLAVLPIDEAEGGFGAASRPEQGASLTSDAAAAAAARTRGGIAADGTGEDAIGVAGAAAEPAQSAAAAARRGVGVDAA